MEYLKPSVPFSHRRRRCKSRFSFNITAGGSSVDIGTLIGLHLVGNSDIVIGLVLGIHVKEEHIMGDDRHGGNMH